MQDDPRRQHLIEVYPELAGMQPAATEQLLGEARAVRVPAGAVIFDHHHPCEGFPFVFEGSVRVVKASAQGREIPLYRVGRGETCVISSSCLLAGERYSARGIAERDTQMLLLPKAAFDNLLADGAFRRFVFHLFAERIAGLMRLVEEVAFLRLDQRLAGVLLGKGRTLRMTHQQLADELGSVREIVSRLLKGFAAQGLVQLGREQIDILDPARLRELSGQTPSGPV